VNIALSAFTMGVSVPEYEQWSLPKAMKYSEAIAGSLQRIMKGETKDEPIVQLQQFIPRENVRYAIRK